MSDVLLLSFVDFQFQFSRKLYPIIIVRQLILGITMSLTESLVVFSTDFVQLSLSYCFYFSFCLYKCSYFKLVFTDLIFVKSIFFCLLLFFFLSFFSSIGIDVICAAFLNSGSNQILLFLEVNKVMNASHPAGK